MVKKTEGKMEGWPDTIEDECTVEAHFRIADFYMETILLLLKDV